MRIFKKILGCFLLLISIATFIVFNYYVPLEILENLMIELGISIFIAITLQAGIFILGDY